jgi:hypothetical protein
MIDSLASGSSFGAVEVDTDVVKVELRSVPDCPNLAEVRPSLFAALADLGLPSDVTELVGDYPSPSVVVDGRT